MSNAVLKSLMCLDVKLVYKWLSWCKSTAIGCEDYIQIIEICTCKLSPCLQFVSKLHDTSVGLIYRHMCRISTPVSRNLPTRLVYLEAIPSLYKCEPGRDAS
jgi:hypothetical protein